MGRAILYARVSTEEQAERYGLASQVTELRALAARRGDTIVAECLDEGISGIVLERPGLDRLRGLVRARGADAVLVHAPDRLARALAHQLLVVEEIRRHGLLLVVASGTVEDTAEGRLLLNVQGVIAEYEREKIRERTGRGRREKARRGLVVGGEAPFGYRWAQAGVLEILEPEAEVVRLAYRRLLGGTSVRALVRELRTLDVRPRRSARWASSSVYRMLTSEVYAGRAWYNRRDTAAPGPGLRWRDRAEWIPADVPVIIERDTWERAQAILATHRAALGGRPTPRIYLLRGLLRCGRCGRPLAGCPSHGRRFYRCRGRDSLAAVRCGAGLLHADRAEAAVWGTVTAVLQDPDVLARHLDAHQVQLGEQAVEIRSEVAYLTGRLRDLEARQQRAVDLLLDVTLDAQVPALRERLAALAAERPALEARLEAARARERRHADEDARARTVAALCQRVLAGLRRLPADRRRDVLAALVDQVVVHKDRLEIHGLLPTYTPAGYCPDRQEVVDSSQRYVIDVALAR